MHWLRPCFFTYHPLINLQNQKIDSDARSLEIFQRRRTTSTATAENYVATKQMN